MVKLTLLIILFLLFLLYYKYSTLKYNFMCIKYQNKTKINNFILNILIKLYNINTLLLEYLSNDLIKELILQIKIPYKTIEILKLILIEINKKIKKYLSR